MTSETISDKNRRVIYLETRKGKTYKINVRICVADSIEEYKGIVLDNPYKIKISEKWGECVCVCVCVKKWVSLKGIPNHPQNIVLQDITGSFRARWRGLIIELVIVGFTAQVWWINHFKRGWWNKMLYVESDEILIIYFVVKRLKLCVSKTDGNQRDIFGKDGRDSGEKGKEDESRIVEILRIEWEQLILPPTLFETNTWVYIYHEGRTVLIWKIRGLKRQEVLGLRWLNKEIHFK